jgi:hypothetical protein
VNNNRSAQTFLALVFLIGGIIALSGIMLAFLATSFIDSGYGFQSSVKAEATANSGVQDALLQLDRNPSFSSVGYSLPVASNTATVAVTQNSPSSGFITVLSQATVSAHIRKVNVVLSENAVTGQLNIISERDIQ